LPMDSMTCAVHLKRWSKNLFTQSRYSPHPHTLNNLYGGVVTTFALLCHDPSWYRLSLKMTDSQGIMFRSK
jgi:hypothetical protein